MNEWKRENPQNRTDTQLKREKVRGEREGEEANGIS